MNDPRFQEGLRKMQEGLKQMQETLRKNMQAPPSRGFDPGAPVEGEENEEEETIDE